MRIKDTAPLMKTALSEDFLRQGCTKGGGNIDLFMMDQNLSPIVKFDKKVEAGKFLVDDFDIS